MDERGEAKPRGPWRDLALVLMLVAPLFALGISGRSYWLTDEPFVAEVGREMLVSDDWVLPRLNGSPFLEKPPLHYAAIAASYALFGESPAAARIPSAFAGLLTSVLVYFLGRKLFERETGILAALLLPTLFLPFYIAHYALVDASLMLFVTAGLLCASYAFLPPRPLWAFLGLWACAALAFLAKGPVGPVLLGVGLIAFALSERDRAFFRLRAHALGAALFAGLTLPWVAALGAEGGAPALREALLVNTVGRAFAVPGLVPARDTLATHSAPFYDYLGGFLGESMPWTPLLLMALAAALPVGMFKALPAGWRRVRADLPRGTRFCFAFFLAGLLFLSFMSTKRSLYLAPIFPTLAVLAAWRVQSLCAPEGAKARWERVLLWVQTVLLGLFSLAVAGLYVYLSGPVEDLPVLVGTWLVAAVVAAAALAATVLAGLLLVRNRRGIWLRVAWGQAAATFVALILLCFPLLDEQKSFAPFFSEARAEEHRRGMTPELLLSNESYIGLACLHFGRTLPVARIATGDPRSRRDSERVGGGDPDILTDGAGLEALRAACKKPPEILVSQVIGGPGTGRRLVLVHLDAPAPIDRREVRSGK